MIILRYMTCGTSFNIEIRLCLCILSLRRNLFFFEMILVVPVVVKTLAAKRQSLLRLPWQANWIYSIMTTDFLEKFCSSRYDLRGDIIYQERGRRVHLLCFKSKSIIILLLLLGISGTFCEFWGVQRRGSYRRKAIAQT